MFARTLPSPDLSRLILSNLFSADVDHDRNQHCPQHGGLDLAGASRTAIRGLTFFLPWVRGGKKDRKKKPRFKSKKAFSEDFIRTKNPGS